MAPPTTTTAAHFLLIPFLSPGHMIPMIDLALLLARHGASVTLLTTTANAARVKPTIDHCLAAPLPVRFLVLPLPTAAAGLPEGCENVDALPSRQSMPNLIHASSLLHRPLLDLLKDDESTTTHFPLPSCVISDAFLSWTQDLSRELQVPRYVFHGYGALSLLCWHNLHQHGTHLAAASDTDPFVIPGLPHRIEMTRDKLPAAFDRNNKSKDIVEKIRVSEVAADGVVVNSFYELEPEYVEAYWAVTGKKVWTIGPLSLQIHEKDPLKAMDRGNRAEEGGRCMQWLDKKEAGSVVYVSFGSLARLPARQLAEVGLGLEASGHPFLWVVRTGEKAAEEVEEWLEREGFEGRTEGRGLVVRGWAPQVAVLSHRATGCFLTHCGWNSTVEALSAGVAMVTWPLFAEQFWNERLVVDVLGVGVAVGVTGKVGFGEEEKAGVAVGRVMVAESVGRVMGEEGEGMRGRARAVGEAARRAVDEGGSSDVHLESLVRESIDKVRHVDVLVGVSQNEGLVWTLAYRLDMQRHVSVDDRNDWEVL